MVAGLLATAASASSDPFLAYSLSGDRSGEQPLDGATIQSGEDVAIFVAPLDTKANRVKFFVNGKRAKLEFFRPYDLGGTRFDGSAALISADHFKDGDNRVVAKIYTGWWSYRTIEATFTKAPPEPELPTIAEIAVGEPELSTLVTALGLATDAGVVDFLGAVSDPDADLTVFAPTNDAFAALGDTLDAALADPGGLLTQVLAYHVLGSSESGAELVAAGSAVTLGGESVVVSVRHGDVFINDSKVVIADIQASNGIVHVIDAVLVPPSITDPEPHPRAGWGKDRRPTGHDLSHRSKKLRLGR